MRHRGRELGQETLVYLVREGLRTGDHDLVDAAATKMLPRLEPIAKKTAAGWFDWEEVYQQALSVMWKDFIEKQDRPLIFWEERCYLAFKRKCLQAVNGMQRHAEREAELLESVGREEPVRTDADVEEAVRVLDPRAIVIVLRGLNAKQRQAVYLAWHKKRPVSGGEGSVSHTMGISASMVHRYLRNAKTRIAELRETDNELRSILGLGE